MKKVLRSVNSFEVYAKSVRHEMLRFVPETANTILDVGCSVGNFGALLKQTREVEIWGVEVDQIAADDARKKLDEVRCGEFNREIGLSKDYFDCIIFNDVLEHMIDPYQALEYAKELLRCDGKIVASIPNVRYFDNIWSLLVHQNWEYVDTGILDRTHLRFFTQKSIKAMFEDLGYRVELLHGINPLKNRRQNKIFKVLNTLALDRLEDMRWLQFAVVAVPGSGNRVSE